MQRDSVHTACDPARISPLEQFWVEETASLVSPQFVVGAGVGALMMLLAISPLGDRFADKLRDFREGISSFAQAQSFDNLRPTSPSTATPRSPNDSAEPDTGCIVVFNP